MDFEITSYKSYDSIYMRHPEQSIIETGSRIVIARDSRRSRNGYI
jgi:hypothetical protein